MSEPLYPHKLPKSLHALLESKDALYVRFQLEQDAFSGVVLSSLSEQVRDAAAGSNPIAEWSICIETGGCALANSVAEQ